MPVPNPNDICGPYFKNHSATVVPSWSRVELVGGPSSCTALSKVKLPIREFQSGFGVDAQPGLTMIKAARITHDWKQTRNISIIMIAVWQTKVRNQSQVRQGRVRNVAQSCTLR